MSRIEELPWEDEPPKMVEQLSNPEPTETRTVNHQKARSSRMIIPRLYFLQQDEQLLLKSFTRAWVVNGPGHCLVAPLVNIQKRRGITLTVSEFIKIHNSISGEVHVESGSGLVFLAADETASQMAGDFVLRQNEYMKLLDRSTGRVRVEIGEKQVVPGPYEEILQLTATGITIDEHTVVLERNMKDGNFRFVRG